MHGRSERKMFVCTNHVAEDWLPDLEGTHYTAHLQAKFPRSAGGYVCLAVGKFSCPDIDNDKESVYIRL